MVAEEVFACKQTASQDLADGWKKHEPQLQADGTRFDLFYSADGSDGATVYTFLYFYGAKIHFSNDICKSWWHFSSDF